MLRYLSLEDAAPGVVRIEKRTAEEPDLLLTLKAGGDMKNAENRRRLEENGIPLPLTLKQVHSKRVVWADQIGAAEENKEADGLLSSDPEVFLGVTVADCMPVYLFAPVPQDKSPRSKSPRSKYVFGILHSGWQGTGIVREALALMQLRMGIEAETVSVVLGPSIRNCCYRVDSERGTLFSSLWGDDAVRFDKKSKETYLDLVQANLGILGNEGVRDIRVVDACTQCDTRFGSFRREGPEKYTHMLAITGFFK